MNLPVVSHQFNDLFFKYKNNIDKTTFQVNKFILKDFFRLIEVSKKNTKRHENDHTNYKKIIINNKNRPKILNNFSFLKEKNSFISNKIQSILIKKIKHILFFEVKIGNISYSINIFLLNNRHYDLNKIRLKIIQLLYFISFFITNDKVKTLKINLLFSDLQKKFPRKQSEMLSSFHINTGVTWPCAKDGEIVIYREEEWYKVLIHEICHSLCFDFSTLKLNDMMKNKIKHMFNVEHSEFSLTETYCEFWANIINSLMMAYEVSENYNHFVESFKIFNTMERYFSIFQTIKILNYFDLNYNILTSDNCKHRAISKKKYKENTNVLCYFIIKMIWLFFTNDMIVWFYNHNHKNLINSEKNYFYLISLIEKTETLYKHPTLLKAIKNYTIIFNQMNMGLPNMLSTYPMLMQSLRMTIIDTIN